MGILKTDERGNGVIGSAAATGSFNALLDKGSEFEGKLTFEGTVRIDGKFKGEIFSDANLIVGESGKVEADIKVNELTVKGEIVGNIIARSRVTIKSPAVVRGNINTPNLVIEEGVTFEGHCVMGKTSKGSRGELDTPPFVKKENDNPEQPKERFDS